MCWNEWKTISQIFPIFNFWVIGVQNVTKDAQKSKIFFKSLQERFELIRQWFFAQMIFCTILSFWDIVDFIDNFVHNFLVFWVKNDVYLKKLCCDCNIFLFITLLNFNSDMSLFIFYCIMFSFIVTSTILYPWQTKKRWDLFHPWHLFEHFLSRNQHMCSWTTVL